MQRLRSEHSHLNHTVQESKELGNSVTGTAN